jgi:tripartite-type tricarboxylate transporter receptor subunit TctC
MLHTTRARLASIGCAAALATLAGTTGPVRAQQDFYAGKQITFIVGAGVGGGYDLQARTTARHLARHIPPPITCSLRRPRTARR